MLREQPREQSPAAHAAIREGGDQDADLSHLLPLPAPPPAASASATSRDHQPPSTAVVRVIRSQRGSTGRDRSRGAGRHSHGSSRQSPTSASKAAADTAPRMNGEAQDADQIEDFQSRRIPSLQEMYNSWRALEEHVDRIQRLPMFIKARRRDCHTCRVLKRRCVCFDYSELEREFQKTDLFLKRSTLHYTHPSELMGDAPSKTGDVVSLGEPSQSRGSRADDGCRASSSKTQPVENKQKSNRRGGEIDDLGRPLLSAVPQRDSQDENRATYDFNTPVTTLGRDKGKQPEGSTGVAAGATTDIPIRAPSAAAVSRSATVGIGRSQPAPRLVKLEIREIMIARELIRNNVRRWRCLFGSSGLPGSPVCIREDDNLNTIRRHYGREHGRHRYYLRPQPRVRCTRCDATFDEKPDKTEMPEKCPRCNGGRDAWIHELYAQIEVPVPQEEHNGDVHAVHNHSHGSDTAVSGTVAMQDANDQTAQKSMEAPNAGASDAEKQVSVQDPGPVPAVASASTQVPSLNPVPDLTASFLMPPPLSIAPVVSMEGETASSIASWPSSIIQTTTPTTVASISSDTSINVDTAAPLFSPTYNPLGIMNGWSPDMISCSQEQLTQQAPTHSQTLLDNNLLQPIENMPLFSNELASVACTDSLFDANDLSLVGADDMSGSFELDFEMDMGGDLTLW